MLLVLWKVVEIEKKDTEYSYENFYLTYIRDNGKMLKIIITYEEWIIAEISDWDSANCEAQYKILHNIF